MYSPISAIYTCWILGNYISAQSYVSWSTNWDFCFGYTDSFPASFHHPEKSDMCHHQDFNFRILNLTV